MKRKNTADRLFIGLVVLLLGLIAAAIFIWFSGRKASDAVPLSTPRSASEASSGQSIGLIKVEKEITADIIQEGLRDMGILETQEYSFTEVVSFSSVKKLFGSIELKITESTYLASYDGVITAGIDFSQIEVEKNEAEMTVTVFLPAASILNVDIDPESFELYDEKSGVGNPVSVEDFNNSLLELETNAKTKALERGILEKADENAKSIVMNFVSGLFSGSGYNILIVEK